MKLTATSESAINFTLVDDQRPVLLDGGEAASRRHAIETDAETLAVPLAGCGAATFILASVPAPSSHRN